MERLLNKNQRLWKTIRRISRSVRPCVMWIEVPCQSAWDTVQRTPLLTSHWKKSRRREPSSLALAPGQWGWSGNKHPAELFTHGSSLGLITCAGPHPLWHRAPNCKLLKELTMDIDSSPSHFLSVVCGDTWLPLWYGGNETKAFAGFACTGSLWREIWFVCADEM